MVGDSGAALDTNMSFPDHQEAISLLLKQQQQVIHELQLQNASLREKTIEKEALRDEVLRTVREEFAQPTGVRRKRKPQLCSPSSSKNGYHQTSTKTYVDSPEMKDESVLDRLESEGQSEAENIHELLKKLSRGGVLGQGKRHQQRSNKNAVDRRIDLREQERANNFLSLNPLVGSTSRIRNHNNNDCNVSKRDRRPKTTAGPSDFSNSGEGRGALGGLYGGLIRERVEGKPSVVKRPSTSISLDVRSQDMLTRSQSLISNSRRPRPQTSETGSLGLTEIETANACIPVTTDEGTFPSLMSEVDEFPLPTPSPMKSPVTPNNTVTRKGQVESPDKALDVPVGNGKVAEAVLRDDTYGDAWEHDEVIQSEGAEHVGQVEPRNLNGRKSISFLENDPLETLDSKFAATSPVHISNSIADSEDAAVEAPRAQTAVGTGRRMSSDRRCGTAGGGTRPSKRAGSVGGDKQESEDLWENHIARNILNLYQTKLTTDLDVKAKTKEENSAAMHRQYLTVEEEQQAYGMAHSADVSMVATLGASSILPSTIGSATSGMSKSGPLGAKRASTANSLQGSGRLSKRSPDQYEPKLYSFSAPNSPEAGHTSPHTGGARPSTVATDRILENSTGNRTRARSPLKLTSTSPGGLNGIEPAVRDALASRGGSKGSRAIIVPQRNGGVTAVVVPKRAIPIWFAGTGAIQPEWTALPSGARVSRDLQKLEEQGMYKKYIALVEGLLLGASEEASSSNGTAPLEAGGSINSTKTVTLSGLACLLWRQLVVTACAFGVRCAEQKRYAQALELLRKAELLSVRESLDKRLSIELMAHVNDSYGFYYLKRGKAAAALDYVQKAMKVHVKRSDWAQVATCHLHIGMVLSRLNRHDEALRCLGQVLSLVQEEKLDVGEQPQRLCMVALCYHNIAVEHLIMRHLPEACTCSQNARRIARLCLSYSNRWLHSFEGLHKLALAELALHDPNVKYADPKQAALMKRLTDDLFC